MAFLQKALSELIAIDTTAGREHAGQTYLRDLVAQSGARRVELRAPKQSQIAATLEIPPPVSPEYPAPSLVAWFGQGKERYPAVVLNSHVDTVAPSTEWKTDPWKPQVRDSRVYGLGACDAKGGLVSLLSAIRMAQRAAGPLLGTVIYQCVSDEEAGGGTGTASLLETARNADLAIIAEPTDLRICTAQSGSFAARATIRGRAAHANTKWRGISAIDRALPFLQSLHDLEQERKQLTHPLLPSPVINIGRLAGGVGATSVADELSVELCATYFPAEGEILPRDLERLYQESVLTPGAQLHVADDWVVLHNVNAYSLDGVTELVAKLLSTAGRLLGTRYAAPDGFPAGSDGRLLNNIEAVPTVIFGPGRLNEAHAPDEYVPVQQLTDHAVVIASFLVACMT